MTCCSLEQVVQNVVVGMGIVVARLQVEFGVAFCILRKLDIDRRCRSDISQDPLYAQGLSFLNLGARYAVRIKPCAGLRLIRPSRKPTLIRSQTKRNYRCQYRQQGQDDAKGERPLYSLRRRIWFVTHVS